MLWRKIVAKLRRWHLHRVKRPFAIFQIHFYSHVLTVLAKSVDLWKQPVYIGSHSLNIVSDINYTCAHNCSAILKTAPLAFSFGFDFIFWVSVQATSARCRIPNLSCNCTGFVHLLSMCPLSALRLIFYHFMKGGGCVEEMRNSSRWKSKWIMVT